MKEKDLYDQLSGEWVLYFNDEIVEHNNNIEEILRIAEEKYPPDKFPNDEIKISKILTQGVRLL